MRFDGYGCYIPEGTTSLRTVVECLADTFQTKPTPGPTMRRWGETTALEVDGRMAAWVGFSRVDGGIYVEGKGETSPTLVKSLRTHFPGHSAPRIDVAEDYDEEGAFERLQRLVRSAKGDRVKGGYTALPDRQDEGRTWAAGVRGAPGYIRVYEAGKHPDRVHLTRPHWARVEAELRPHYSRDKRAAACMSPIEAWGLTAWTHRVGTALAQTDIPRWEPEVRRYTHDRTIRYVANMFRRHWEEMLSNGEDIGRTFQAVWEEEDDYRRRNGTKH